MRLYWDLVDHAYGKPVQSVEVRAGPIPVAELETWSDETARMKELEATSRQEEAG